MTKDDQARDLLTGMTPPSPPPELRERALAAAAAVAWNSESREEVWTRLRSSTALRFAWAATIFVLLCGHLVLSLPSRQLGYSSEPVLVVAGAASGGELGELVELGADASRSIPSLDATTILSEIERRTNHGI